MNISLQKSDCKNSKSSIESVDKSINFTLSCFALTFFKKCRLFWYLSLYLTKFLLGLEWVIHLFFDHLLDQDTHHHCHPLSCFSFFGTISIILFALSIRFVIGQPKSVFRASTVGICRGKNVSS